MKLKEAETAIRAILAAVDNDQLPKPRRDKSDPSLYWFGGRGHHVGTAERAGVREPDVHRSFGLDGLFEGEKMARIDAKHLKKSAVTP